MQDLLGNREAKGPRIQMVLCARRVFVSKQPLEKIEAVDSRFDFPSTSGAHSSTDHSYASASSSSRCRYTPLSIPRSPRGIAFSPVGGEFLSLSLPPPFPLFVQLFSHESNGILIYTEDARRDLL